MNLAITRLFDPDLSLSSERRVCRALLRVADAGLVGFIFSSTVSITFEQASIIVAFLAWSLAVLFGYRPGYKKGLLELSFLLLLVSQLASSLLSARMGESLSGMRDLFFVSIVYLFATLTRTERRMKEFIYLLVFSATLMSIYGLAESLSSWIALFFAVLLIGIVGARKLIPALLVGTLLVYALGPASIRSRAASILDPSESSGFMRLELLKASPRVIRDHPLTGVGLVDLLPVYDEYVRPHVPEHLKEIRLGHFHNNVVQVAVQTGIFGLTTFLFLMFNVVRSEWEGYRAAGDRFLVSVSLGSLAAFVAFSINGLFEYNFGDSEVVMLMWFTLGLSLASKRLSACALSGG